MNLNKEYNKKLFVVREYSNSETATANTDILEYLYQCGDSMKRAAETSLRIARTMIQNTRDMSLTYVDVNGQ
jgi:Zn-finger domain-containing protein